MESIINTIRILILNIGNSTLFQEDPIYIMILSFAIFPVVDIIINYFDL